MKPWIWRLALGVGGFYLLMAAFQLAITGHEYSRIQTCASTLKQLGSAVRLYADDHDETLPPAATWRTAVGPEVTAVFGKAAIYADKCPVRTGPAFAFNDALDRLPLAKVAAQADAPLLFESRLGTMNAHDRLESFIGPHFGQGNVLFVDGHVEGLRWAPKATEGLGGQGTSAK